MKYNKVDKIIDFFEYVYLCAKRQSILEKEGSESLAEIKEYDSNVISKMRKHVTDNMDTLTYLNLLRSQKALEENCGTNTYLYIANNAYDKTMQDVTIVGDSGNIFTIHVLQNGRIILAGEPNIPIETSDDVDVADISAYLFILGKCLKSYLQGNDQQDMYLCISGIVRIIDLYLYTFATPKFKELTEYTSFYISLVMGCDKFFPCNAEYRKNLLVLEEKDDNNYYVHIKSADKICTIKYNNNNKSLSFSLSALDK